MKTVVGVQFYKSNKVYYFSPNRIACQVGDDVVVETARGAEIARVAQGPMEVEDAARRPWQMRLPGLLPALFAGIFSRIHQNGQGTEHLSQPHQNQRPVRAADVLLELRAAVL